MPVLPLLIVPVVSAPVLALTCAEVRGLADRAVPTTVIVSVIADAATLPSDLPACLQDHGVAPAIVAAAQRHVRPQPRSDAAALPVPEPARAVDSAESSLLRISALVDHQKPLAASALAAELIASTASPSTTRQARYLLAKALRDLKLHGSASAQLRTLVHESTQDDVGQAALRALLSPGGTDLAAQLAVLGPLLPDVANLEDLPAGPADAAAYLQGQARLDAGDRTGARRAFARVGGPLEGGTDLLRAAIAHEQGYVRTSAASTQSAWRWAVAHHDADLQDQAALMFGRLTYSQGLMEPSAEAYAHVLPGRPLWPDAREEQAWAWFVGGQTDRALGNAVALDSPWGREVPTPEVDLIKGIARLEACRFDAAAQTASDLARNLRGTVDALDLWLQAAQPQTAWTHAIGEASTSAAPHGAPPLPIELWRVALRDHRLSAHARHLQRLDAERERISHQKAAWVDVVGQDLIAGLDAERAQVAHAAGQRAIVSMSRQRAHLADVLAQADVLAFEAVDGQRRMLQALARDPAPSTLDASAAIDFAVATDVVYWPFNGEFWADELDHYRVELPSVCGELAMTAGSRVAGHRM